MSNIEKITKLSNAVREYRGVASSPVGAPKVEWLHPPRRAEEKRVRAWLARLGIADVDATIAQIDAMKSYDEFHEWLKTI